MQTDMVGLHEQLNAMQNNYGTENFNDAIHQVMELMERHEAQAKKEVGRTLDETMEHLRTQQRNTTKKSFRRLSALDHHVRDTSNLVKDEIENKNADVNDLHDLTVQEIHNLSEKARAQLNAIQNIGDRMQLWEEERKGNPSQPVISMSASSSHVLEHALTLSEARCEKMELQCEKMELQYERAVGHVRHLHAVCHSRRTKMQSRLAQLVALETVFLNSEGVHGSESVGMNIAPQKRVKRTRKRHGKFHKNRGGGDLVGESKKPASRGTAVVHLWR